MLKQRNLFCVKCNCLKTALFIDYVIPLYLIVMKTKIITYITPVEDIIKSILMTKNIYKEFPSI
jgi:hypothetical protein